MTRKASSRCSTLPKKLEAAFGETLVRVPTVTDVRSTDVLLRGRSEIATTRRPDLYPLNDAGLSAHGPKVPNIMGDNYVQTWNLSAYVHANTKADGILYASRFDNGECIALFDRAADAVTTTDLPGEAVTPELATQLAMTFGKSYADP